MKARPSNIVIHCLVSLDTGCTFEKKTANALDCEYSYKLVAELPVQKYRRKAWNSSLTANWWNEKQMIRELSTSTRIFKPVTFRTKFYTLKAVLRAVVIQLRKQSKQYQLSWNGHILNIEYDTVSRQQTWNYNPALYAWNISLMTNQCSLHITNLFKLVFEESW